MPPAALADRLGYAFRRPALLEQALTHRSHGAPHNERLEFLGDAVLDFVVATILYERYPDVPEGDLSRIRAHLVKGETLARLARTLDLERFVRLGEVAKSTGTAGRTSIAADALEAIFGAAFLDGGLEAACDVIGKVYAEDLARLDPAALGKDPKTRLQEWLQARRMTAPEYVLVTTSGASPAQSFTVECRMPPLSLVTSGVGRSRRAAEQDAAALALERIAKTGDAGLARA
jgi:ribonuclease III